MCKLDRSKRFRTTFFLILFVRRIGNDDEK